MQAKTLTNDEIKRRIVYFYNDGYPKWELAEKYGLSLKEVINIIEQHQKEEACLYFHKDDTSNLVIHIS